MAMATAMRHVGAFVLFVCGLAALTSGQQPAAGAARGQQPTTALVGVVLGADGEPLPQVEVVIARGEGRGFSCLDLELRASWRELVRTRTDKAGRFGTQVPLGHELRVEVDHPAHARWRREAVVAGGDLRIRLEPPCTVRGRLVLADTSTGTPGRVLVRGEWPVELASARTDAAGNYVFERLPPGPVTIQAEPDEASAPEWVQATLQPDRPLVQEFACAPGTVLVGTVTDASTGAPLAGARIGEGWTLHKAVTTDAAGRYELRGFGSPGYGEVDCDLRGFVRSIHRYPPAEVPTTLDFALDRGLDVTGTVLDARGKPIANAYCAVVSVQPEAIVWLHARSSGDGTFTCEGLPATAIVEGVLLVRGDGFGTAIWSLPPPVAGVIDVGRLTLQLPRVVQGVVLDGKGKPVPDAVVSLRGSNEDCEQFAALPITWALLAHYVGERVSKSDADGRFAFGDVAPGSYELALGDTFTGAPPLMRYTIGAEDVVGIKLWQ